MNKGQINAKGVWVVLIIIGVFFLFVHTASFILFRIFNKPKPEPVVESNFKRTSVVLKGPFLQSSPGQELSELRKKEDRGLHSYGWIDPSKGVIRIPINRSIDLLAKDKEPL